jgi:glycosyltransferase involved in cell wall biosynthesis
MERRNTLGSSAGEIRLINLTAPINNLGYGVAGYNIFKSLYYINPSVALYPISKPEFVDEFVVAGIENQGIRYADMIRERSFEYPSVKIWHQNDLHSHVGKNLHIGFPIFELTEFDEEEKRSMEHCDRMFVCSQWAKDIVIDQTKFTSKTVHVVPLGVDTELFKPSKSSRSPTIFFNCGKWEKRKGHDILLECFNRAFSPSDDVELWMMCDNPFIGPDNQKWINLYKNSPLGGSIRIIPRQQTHKDVYNIMKQTDCGVFPARAEGWNLELLEMMACGKTVIATNYSAHTEFCNLDNCLLVNIDGLEQANDGVFFSGSHGEWANFSESSTEQLVEHMKTVHDRKHCGSDRLLNVNGIATAKQFTWQNSARELLNGL